MSKYSKVELRKSYLAKRKSLSEEEIKFLSKNIFDKLKKEFDWSKISNIHIFLSSQKQKEVETLEFIKELLSEGKRVFIPKVFNDQLQCYELTNETILKENSWGILEPEGNPISGPISIDVVIAPLVYCDKKGNRIGYGKGFYDRFFTQINPKALKIGVGFFAPQEEVGDISKEDVVLDYLLTPSSVFSFRSKSIK